MPFSERTRLFLPTLAVSLLLFLLGGFSAWYMHQSQREAVRLQASGITRVRATEELVLIGERMDKSLDQFLLTGDRMYLEPIPKLKREADDWTARLATIDQDQARAQALTAGFARFVDKVDTLTREPAATTNPRKAIANVNTILERDVLQPVREYQRLGRDRLAKRTSGTRLLTDRMGLALLLLGISGAVAGLWTGFTVARHVQRRLVDGKQAMDRSQQLATLGRVAAALAHELRNPLTSMRIIVQSASTKDGHVSLDARDFSILEQEIDRLDGSIQTFLDYARPPRPEKRTCIVQSLLRQTISLVERRAEQTGVEIRVDLPAEPIEIDADPGQMKQVLLNILINALDASPGGGVVNVRSTALSPGHGRAGGKLSHFSEVVEISIEDSGGGLPNDLGDRIFDAFVSTKETGTGLGLSICKRIIEDHGGEIDAHNASEAGAVFTVRLPASQRQTAEIPRAADAISHP